MATGDRKGRPYAAECVWKRSFTAVTLPGILGTTECTRKS